MCFSFSEFRYYVGTIRENIPKFPFINVDRKLEKKKIFRGLPADVFLQISCYEEILVNNSFFVYLQIIRDNNGIHLKFIWLFFFWGGVLLISIVYWYPQQDIQLRLFSFFISIIFHHCECIYLYICKRGKKSSCDDIIDCW